MSRQSRALRGAAHAAACCSIALLGIVGATAIDGRAAAGVPAAATIGQKVGDFDLRDTAGKRRTLSEFREKKAVVLVFLGADCPMSNGYSPTLSQLATRYADRGVQLLGVNANPADTEQRMAAHAREYKLTFPVLKDASQALADQVGASVTPEAFVLDAQRVVRYRGRIDDNYAARLQKKSQVTRRDLETAIEAVLAGKPVANPVTTAFGCGIQRPGSSAKQTAKVTYHRDVAAILQERCQDCHRPGQVAPFPLMTYAHAKTWAQEIKTFTQNRQMPPWQAEPGHGDFMDARRLSDNELTTLAAWVDEGSHEGDPKDAPAAKKWPEGWMLGQPDLVLEMPEEYSVEAAGEDVFRCFVLPTGLTEDRQVVAVEVRPGNSRVVHHVLNFVDTQGRGRALDARDPAPGYNSGPGGIGFLPSGGMGGWAPGNFPRYLPKGVGMPLPKGSDIVLQMHYHKTGKPEKDRTRIGIFFAKDPIEKRLRTWPLTNFLIRIPPNQKRHEVKASLTVPMDVKAISITPHMHLLGKEMKVTATYPDGTVRNLVWVKNWDYRWQDTYRYQDLVPIPKGTKIEMTAYFDNSSENPRNPNNPPKEVTFGEQTTDEMAFAFIQFVFDKEPVAGVPSAQLRLAGVR